MNCLRLYTIMAWLCLTFALAACGGGEGGSTGGPSASPTPTPSLIRVARAGEPGGAEVIVVGEDADEVAALIDVAVGPALTIPHSFQAVGGSVAATPPGISFQYPPQLALPVDPALVPSGQTLEDLVVFQIPAGGGLLTFAPIVGVEEDTNRVLICVTDLSRYQVAASTRTFRLDPYDALLQNLGLFMSHQLTTRFASGSVSFAISELTRTDASATETAPEEVEPNDDGNFDIAPGVVMTPQGRIYGTPQETGSWLFSVEATDNDQNGPSTASMSLSLTVTQRTARPFPGFPMDAATWAFTASGDAIVLSVDGGAMTLHRIPADGGATESSPSLATGAINPALAVHPSGEAVAVAYEQVVGNSLAFTRTGLVQVLRADETGLVAGVAVDLDGDAVAEATVDFQADEENGFTGTLAELHAFAEALNTAFTAATLGVDAVVNVSMDGVRIVDNGVGIIAPGIPAGGQSPGILSGGAAIARQAGVVSTGGDGSFRRLWVVEYGENLEVTAGPQRVDADPIFDAENPDTSLTPFSRQAVRPGIAFAASPTATTLEDDSSYLVAWEGISNTDAAGAIRSDVYAQWRLFGGGATTLATRIDATSRFGAVSGNRVLVAGTTTGATVLWTEQGGEDDDAEAASAGDIAAVELTLVATPGTPLAQIAAPTVEFLNDPEASTGLHPAITIASDGTVWAVWTERAEAVAEPEEEAALVAGRGAQTSASQVRRDLALFAGQIAGGTVTDRFQVDVINNASSAYSSSIAVSSEGEVAVTWVEAPFAGAQKGVLRRFVAPGVPLELPLFVAFPVETVIGYDATGRLGLMARTGGSLHLYDFTPGVVPVTE